MYPHAVWYQVLWWKTKRACRKAAIVVGFSAALYAAFSIGLANAQIVYQRGEVIEIDKTPQAYANAQHEVFMILAACESPGLKKGEDGIIWDANDKASVGPVKFQITTMQHYYPKVFDGKTLTRAEAVTAAMDWEVAEKVANYVWFETDNGPKDWVNCNNWHKIQEKVDFIKKAFK